MGLVISFKRSAFDYKSHYKLSRLRHLVSLDIRILSGTLLEVGQGKRTPESMYELLEERNRSLAGATAPAKGLCLLKVDYSKEA